MQGKPVVLKFTLTAKEAADFEKVRAALGPGTTKVAALRRLVKDDIFRRDAEAEESKKESFMSLLERKMDKMLTVCYNIEQLVKRNDKSW